MEGMAILDIGRPMAEGKQCEHPGGKAWVAVKKADRRRW
jgi:hypothetical protein